MEKIDGRSKDMELEARERLKSVFPDCFVEGKLDIDKLLNICGEYIDDDFEKYEFKWKGKNDCIKLIGKRSSGTLRPCVEESVNWDSTKNLYIEGDNLEVLKILQTSYYRKVKMIYIDPPYNTGNDFVYKDDFADPIERYKEVTSQTTKSNPETMGRYHTNWLNMMYPRLRLAATLLRDDGVCFISIDDNEVDNLKKVCNEVFGEENFVANIIWKKRGGPPNDKIIGTVQEYILMYAKNISSISLYRKDRNEEQLSRYKNPDNHPKGAWAADNLMANVKGGRYVSSLYFAIVNPYTGEEHYPSSNGNWRFNKEKIQKLLENNEIYFGEDNKGRPKLKRFLCDVKEGVPFSTLFDDVGFNNRAAAEINEFLGNVNIFDTPKPVDLIKNLLKLGSSNNDIILDFFSGSATTAHAVMQLNAEDAGSRQFIMVQLPELCDEKSEAYKSGYKNICEIGKERIRRAGKKIMTEWKEKQSQIKIDEIGETEETTPPDTGFRVFKLDTSNRLNWDIIGDYSEEYEDFMRRLDNSVNCIKQDRNDMDMIFEILLKVGLRLSSKVEKTDINNKTVYLINDGMILICFNEKIEPEDVEEMAEYAPAFIVFSENCFEDMSAMENAEQALKDTGIEMKFF